MTKYSEFSPEQQKNTLGYVNQRWSQLYHLEKDWSERAVTYLFTSNGTGAIALLSFIGALKNVKSETIWSLVCFLLGIVLAGVLTALTYHKMNFLFETWKADARAYLNNQDEYEEINKKDENRVGNQKLLEVVAYTSFGLFILGLILGVLGILGIPFFATFGHAYFS